MKPGDLFEYNERVAIKPGMLVYCEKLTSVVLAIEKVYNQPNTFGTSYPQWKVLFEDKIKIIDEWCLFPYEDAP